MSVCWLNPSQFTRNVTQAEAEAELVKTAAWLSKAGGSVDLDGRMERVVLIAIWYPKLKPLSRQIARGAAMHPAPMIRSEAAAVLGWLGNRNDYHCLVQLMSDRDNMVRIEAVECLDVVGPRLAIPHFTRILTGDFDSGMERAALHGLDSLNGKGSYNYIVRLTLENPRLSELGRGTAIDYQFRWFGEIFLNDWLDLLTSEHFLAYMRPIWSLSESPEIIDQLSDQAKAKIISAISQFADKAEADEEYPRWQPKAAREVVANLGQRSVS